MATDESTEKSETTVSAKRARELIAGGEATVLDIRSEEEWVSVGNIPGSVNAPDEADEDAAEAVKAIADDRTVIVVCRRGDRSAEVAEQLRDGGREAVSIDGGMEAWQDDNLPLQPSEDPALPGDPGSVEDEVATTDQTSDDDKPQSADEATTSDQPPASEETPTSDRTD
jgi:rhodanese-related sulfurtransferase